MAKTRTARPKANAKDSVFKAINNILRKPGGGCNGFLQYMEQTLWLLFLRYLDAREPERRAEAELTGRSFEPALPQRLAWSDWAWPTTPDGALDTDRMLTGDDLVRFVRDTLFPRLKALAATAAQDSLAYRIGAIFSELNFTVSSGYILREVIDKIQPLSFQTAEERHELSVLYEENLREMGSANREGGQYYTPRPLIRTMVRLVAPKLGETIYDGAFGSAGFLCEAYAYLREKTRDAPDAWDTLQHHTFSGQELQSLAYASGLVNCILHGLESPALLKGNTLDQRHLDFSERDRVDIVLANPPFGAAVDTQNLQNFTHQTRESALLFLQHFLAKLKKGGRAAIIIKNTFLSNTDAASIALRRQLLAQCRLDWVLDLPPKIFAAGVRTVVLFFTKSGPTERIRYWQHTPPPGVSYGKTRPLLESDLAEFEAVATGRKPLDGCDAAWELRAADIPADTCDLSVRNPHIQAAVLPTPSECRARLRDTLARLNALLQDLAP